MPEVIIKGQAGELEAKYQQANASNSPLALILHPHPQHGGTMNNKVVYTLFKAFASKGFTTLRFNFRGVGHSEGNYDNGKGELNDAISALEWLKANNPDSTEIWIAGFSFGAWIALQLLLQRPEISGFIAVSPPTNLYSFDFLSPCPKSGLVIQGNSDTIVDENAVRKFVEKLQKQRDISVRYQMITDADHFFHQKHDLLKSLICHYLEEQLSNKHTQ
jgi:hypothetical protein